MVVRRYPCSRALGNSLADTCLCDYFALFFCLRYVVSSSVCCTVRYHRCYCCFALVVLSLSLAHLLSRSAPLAFWCLVRWLFDTTLQYTLPTHAREHQPVWFVLLHTGLDWTGLDCALRSLRSARRSLVIVG